MFHHLISYLSFFPSLILISSPPLSLSLYLSFSKSKDDLDSSVDLVDGGDTLKLLGHLLVGRALLGVLSELDG